MVIAVSNGNLPSLTKSPFFKGILNGELAVLLAREFMLEFMATPATQIILQFSVQMTFANPVPPIDSIL